MLFGFYVAKIKWYKLIDWLVKHRRPSC